MAIWAASSPGNSLAEREVTARTTLAARYPQARAAVENGSKPMDVSDPELRQRIEADYAALMATAAATRTDALVMELRQRGFVIDTYVGLPSFTAVLPKRVILELAQHPKVSAIYLIEAKAQLELDSAVPTTLAPFVWTRGITGNGVTIAILEEGNVAPDNTYLHQCFNQPYM